MRNVWLAASALALAWNGRAAEAGGEAAESAPVPQLLQVHAREVWTAAGARLEDAVVVIADGKIRSVGPASTLDRKLPHVEHDGVLTAGLIACASQLAGWNAMEDTRAVTPAARAQLAFEPERRAYAEALAAGITTVVLTPGPENLVGGLACAVKTHGKRVAAPEASLALNLSSRALGRSTVSSGFFFGAAEEPAAAQPDGSAESTARTGRGTREPTSYSGAVTMLRELFGRGEGVFGRARKGELPVTLEAWDRHEVLRAAELARELGLSGAVRGAPLAGDEHVVAALKASGLGAILGPYGADQTRASLESLARLAEAGVPVAFATAAPGASPSDLRLSAVRALAAGAPREAVWRALTSDAARLAGVGTSLGELAPGREADLVLWSGDPLDLTSRVVAVYVDGTRAFPAGTH